jgi:hypothetical protein
MRVSGHTDETASNGNVGVGIPRPTFLFYAQKIVVGLPVGNTLGVKVSISVNFPTLSGTFCSRFYML